MVLINDDQNHIADIVLDVWLFDQKFNHPSKYQVDYETTQIYLTILTKKYGRISRFTGLSEHNCADLQIPRIETGFYFIIENTFFKVFQRNFLASSSLNLSYKKVY